MTPFDRLGLMISHPEEIKKWEKENSLVRDCFLPGGSTIGPVRREKTMAANLLDQYEQYELELEEDDPLGCCRGIMVAAGIELAGAAVVFLLYYLFL